MRVDKLSFPAATAVIQEKPKIKDAKNTRLFSYLKNMTESNVSSSVVNTQSNFSSKISPSRNPYEKKRPRGVFFQNVQAQFMKTFNSSSDYKKSNVTNPNDLAMREPPMSSRGTRIVT